jgi:imidazolonepropionase-like amidohydrolase
MAISLVLAVAPGRAAVGQQTVAIRAGEIMTVSGGVVEDGIIIVRDGKIDRVGESLEPPADARIIDVRDMTVVPGFIDAHCHLGLSLDVLGEIDETVQPATAEMQIIDAFDSTAGGIAEAIRSGVTAAVLAPGSRNPIGGQMAAVKLSGDRQVLGQTVGVKLSFSHDALMSDRRPTSLPGLITLVREHLDKAKAYAPGKLDPSAEVLSRLTKRRLPAYVYAQTLDEITAALNIIDQYKLKAVLVGAHQADETTEVLVERKVPVIYGPLLLHSKDKDLKRIVALADAGAKIAFASFAPKTYAGDVRTSAILAVRYGLDREDALKALTINPAAILGLAGRLGSIQKGRDADLVILDGDPLEASSRIEMVIVDGKIVYQREQK